MNDAHCAIQNKTTGFLFSKVMKDLDWRNTQKDDFFVIFRLQRTLGGLAGGGRIRALHSEFLIADQMIVYRVQSQFHIV